MAFLNRSFLVYTPGAFIDREPEIAAVTGLTRKLVEGGRKPGMPRAVTIRGERGSGKTWLSLHLHRHELPKIPGVVSVLISLIPMLVPDYRPYGEKGKGEYFEIVPDERVSDQERQESCKSLLNWVSQELETTTAPDASLDELSNWLARDLEHRNQTFVILLDSIFEVNWLYLKNLESYLLAPLAALPNVLIVLTGRGKLYPWISPYLRVEVEERKLEPFTDERIAEQIKQFSSETKLSVEEIKNIGGGQPLNNFFLATSQDWMQEIDTIIDLLLDIRPGKSRVILRDYFESLCVLDGFREEEIPHMLAAYYQDETRKTMSIIDVRKLRDDMVATNLVRWEDSRFKVDEPLRRLLETYIKTNKREKWQQLQCAAYTLYQKWAKEYPKYADFFLEKAAIHSNC